jgi:hypothetical protein
VGPAAAARWSVLLSALDWLGSSGISLRLLEFPTSASSPNHGTPPEGVIYLARHGFGVGLDDGAAPSHRIHPQCSRPPWRKGLSASAQRAQPIVPEHHAYISSHEYHTFSTPPRTRAHHPLTRTYSFAGAIRLTSQSNPCKQLPGTIFEVN